MNIHGNRVPFFRWRAVAAVFLCIVGSLYWWQYHEEKQVYAALDYEKEELTDMIKCGKPLNDAALEFIYKQTGIGKAGVQTLLSDFLKEQSSAHDMPTEEFVNQLLEIQEIYFAEPSFECTKEAWMIRRDQNIDDQGKIVRRNKLIALEEGDILITDSCHLFGWRNGHAAIVIDGKKGKTLEAITIGEETAVRSISKWEKYPNVAVLRLRDGNKKQRQAIAKWAQNNMKGIPYSLTAGMGECKGTHCAHLVWAAYKEFGYDLDSNGGCIVTPAQLAASPQLCVVQVYGMDLDKFNN